jgi:hypothetical protein
VETKTKDPKPKDPVETKTKDPKPKDPRKCNPKINPDCLKLKTDFPPE